MVRPVRQLQAVGVSSFVIPESARVQLGLFDEAAEAVTATPGTSQVPGKYTVQIVRSFFEMKRGRTITHGRAVAHGYDNRRDPETFCGKPWRHADHGYVYFDVVANVDRDEALDRISCVGCQVELR